MAFFRNEIRSPIIILSEIPNSHCSPIWKFMRKKVRKIISRLENTIWYTYTSILSYVYNVYIYRYRERTFGSSRRPHCDTVAPPPPSHTPTNGAGARADGWARAHHRHCRPATAGLDTRDDQGPHRCYVSTRYPAGRPTVRQAAAALSAYRSAGGAPAAPKWWSV